jgi:2-phospho-L-lactate/phosphoenolpyruvate guanylyltransferase
MHFSDCVILVPSKGFAAPKQRLSPALDGTRRCALARAMLDDVLGALAAWRERPEVAVVTGESEAAAMARARGFEVIEDHEQAGETEAVAAATRLCVRMGVASTLVIPADIPLVTAAELEAVLKGLAPGLAPGTVLVPAADERGTNAVLRRPADLFPLRFGNDSFLPHWLAAQATGHAVSVMRLPGIALDVDNPSDLVALLLQPRRTETQKLLQSWNLSSRLAAGTAAGTTGALASS